MPRPAEALIDLDALRHNYALAAQRAGAARAMAVIKADGYGHGLPQVARALHGHAPQFAVASLEEALRIREAGVTEPVVLLQGVHAPDDWRLAAEHGFQPVLHCAEQCDALQQKSMALAAQGGVLVWLKVNIGMNRLGFPVDALASQIARLHALPGVILRGIISHFACADEPEHPLTEHQLEQIQTLRRTWPDLLFSAANSAAHFRDAGDACFDWTRPGIMLYGASPFEHRSAAELGLRPVMSLRSAVIAVRDLPAGASVGYGAAWVAQRSARMAVVAMGYADGYPRHAPSGTPVWVLGQRVPLMGRVSMDMLAVDVTAHPDVGVGAPVELWGQHVPVDEVATCAGTIGYELLTGVTARVPRRYHAEPARNIHPHEG